MPENQEKTSVASAYFIAKNGNFSFRFGDVGDDSNGLKNGKVNCSSDEKCKVSGARLIKQCQRYCERGLLEEVDAKWTRPKESKGK